MLKWISEKNGGKQTGSDSDSITIYGTVRLAVIVARKDDTVCVRLRGSPGMRFQRGLRVR